MAHQKEIDTLSILLDRMNGCKDGDLPLVFSSADKRAVKLAIKVLKQEDAIHHQQERNNRDALEIANWCARNSETLYRFSQRIKRNVPGSKKN